MTDTDRFVLLPASPSALSVATVSDATPLRDEDSASEVPAQISAPQMHHSLVISMNLERALTVAQVQQQLIRARTIRAQQEAIFEDTVGSADSQLKVDGFRNDCVDIHLKAKAIETRHEELIAERTASMNVVHQFLFESAEHASVQIEALLQAVYLWPEKRINAMRLGELSANERFKMAFIERQRIMGEISTARVAYLDLYDRLSSLCDVTDTWSRREKAITNELDDKRDTIASILAEADKHFGFDVAKRQEQLLKLVSSKLTANQQDQDHVEKWFNLSIGELDVVKDGNIPEAITISERIAARITQLDDLVSALKRSDEALSLRIAASAALNAVEQDATTEDKKMAWTMFQSMDKLEKSMTNCDVEISTEDVVRHILELIDRTAKLLSSNEVVQEVRAKIWDTILVNYGSDIAKTMETSKKLFSLESFSPNTKDVAFATHVLAWNGAPREEKQFAFPFHPPAKDARVLTFFKKIDNDWSEDVCIASDYASDNHVLVKTNGQTHIMSFDVSVLGISANDERFQAGSCCVSASGWRRKNFGNQWINRVKVDFPRPFHSTPKVRLFMSALGAKREDHHDFNTIFWVESVTTQGFTLSAYFVGAHTDKLTLTISWVAHDPNEPTVRSGKIRHTYVGWVANKNGTVSFDKPFAAGAPSILVAGIAGMHCNFPKKNLRFEIQESNVRPEGFDYIAGCWATSRMMSGRWSWIAIQ